MKHFSKKNLIYQTLQSYCIYILCIFALGTLILESQERLVDFAKLSILDSNANESDAFRIQKFTEESFQAFLGFADEYDLDKETLLTALMTEFHFDLSLWNYKNYTINYYQDDVAEKLRYQEKGFDELEDSYKAIWSDVVYFPVAKSLNKEIKPVSYEDTWLFERNYGGKRGHEGTDIMAGENIRGLYPIVSMTDGVVEKIGWLEQGGYRIGIRSTHGGYFYYAHLANYASEYQEGDVITAGQLLGYMGDTGYSTKVGTTGNFDVHLHLGIYIRTQHNYELSVNPYWVLRYIEDSTLEYKY